MQQAELDSLERRLTSTLAAWAVGSVAIGSLLMAAGRGGRRPDLAGFGRQAVMWGAIDGVIAGAGALSRARRGPLEPDEVNAKARGLQRILAINTAADVAYVVAGATITSRARRGRPLWRMTAGDGASIIVQGGFLLALDAIHLREITHARSASTSTHASNPEGTRA